VSAQYVHALNMTVLNKTGKILIRKHRGPFIQTLLLLKIIKWNIF